jgi:arylsulfatase A-like enzyme
MKKSSKALLLILLAGTWMHASGQTSSNKPNIIYFLVDNLGLGELGCYDGGLTRGAITPRIDNLAEQGMQLWNFAPETQCTPSRSALMTGRYSIRSGNHTVALAGSPGGLVTWERTMAEVLSDDGYATACEGKWHIGASDGRWPTDNGFDEWYGPAHSYDEALWVEDPWYDAARDGISYMYEGTKGQKVKTTVQLAREVKRNVDIEYMKRGKAFMKKNVASHKPFFLYFNYSLMHMPNDPRLEFKGKSGHGDWADCIMQLDADLGTLMDYLKEIGADKNTIVVFSGDNGPEYMEPWRGDPGRFSGSYFTGMEGSLRTPCIINYPSKVPAKQVSNEIVHITDMYTTLINWAGAKVPTDRVIDGLDQRNFFEGKQNKSEREGFPYWMGETMYGVKWQNFKAVFVVKRTFADPEQKLATPWMINLDVDPKEEKPYDYPYLHSWMMAHVGKILSDYGKSIKKEPLIPAGAPLDFVPTAK